MQRRAGGVATENDEVDLHVRRLEIRIGAEEAAGITGADGQQPLARDDVAQPAAMLCRQLLITSFMVIGSVQRYCMRTCR